jgi:tRNA A37 threonylcarbamoyladenosine modification protein TsaB
MVPDHHQRLICLGDGGEKLIGQLGSYSYVFYPVMSNASWMAPLAFEQFKKGSFESIETSEPFYLKPPNITTPKNRIL